MLDGLLKPKFYTKCKSSLKMIKTRLEVIKKKRSSVERFLKNDVAELLKNGFDYNAYGRADGLLVEQNMTSCYEDVDKFCGIIYGQLSTIQKQRECPEECREAVSSLLYAAARFADLPELRDLRTMLTEKYGNSLEPFMNKDFVEKLRGNPVADEMKIQLMYEIAKEFSIKWDSRALEKKLFNPSQPANDQPKHRHLKDDAAGYECQKSRNKDSPKRDSSWDSQNQLNDARQPKRNVTDHKHMLSSSSNDVKEAGPSSLRNGSKNHVDYNDPSPYIKSNLSKKDNSAADKNPKPTSVRRRNPKPTPDRENISSVEKDDLRREPRRQHLQTSNDQRDEEEMQMDKLLVHYSKKKSPYKADREIGEHLKLKPSKERHRSVKSELPRASTLPTETAYPIKQTIKHLRVNSVQPDMLAGHVHPKLPKYEDLAARIAALRG